MKKKYKLKLSSNLSYSVLKQIGQHPPDLTSAAVGGKYNDGCNRRLESTMQVREALDVEHVDLVDEENAWHELGDALLNVLVDDLVNLLAQLVWRPKMKAACFFSDSHYAFR